jgi:heat-inducible transcriptional repressor
VLTERRSRILSLIIDEYVDTATPVGSATIVRKHRLPVSPATIRNEMARLEEDGYITHPHTSAGRVPSDQGYRYYVETLMEEESLPWQERETIRHQFHQAGGALRDWLNLSAAILAQAVQNVAVVTTPRAPACRLRHIELVGLQEFAALLVVVLQETRVIERLLALSEGLSQEDLSVTGHRLTDLLEGLDTRQIRAREAALSPFEAQVVDAVCEMMSLEDEGRHDETVLDGLRHVLGQPEFTSSDRLLELIDALEERKLTRLLPLRRLAGEGVTVFIGGENRADTMRHFSVIVSRYGVPGYLNGAVAVVGPTRMRYSRTISTVRYLSSLMSELLPASGI